jgi:hypothetical protein
MKTHLLIAALLVVSLLASAQTEEKKEKLSRKERKELRKIEKEETRKKVTKLIESKQYVLKADYLKNPFGHYRSVNESKNFIWVDSLLSVFQMVEYRAGMAGGLVGLTIEGKIYDYELIPHKRLKSNYIRFKVKSYDGDYRVFMEVMANGKTSAQIYNYIGQRMDYQGRLVSQDEAGILMGKGY